jgi:hypothetical protein
MTEIKKETEYIASKVINETILETVRVGLDHKLLVYENGSYDLLDTFEYEGISYLPIRVNSSLIKSKLLEFSGLPLDYESSLSLHTKIISFLDRYVTLSPDFLKLVASYIMLTWIYEAFNELPYLRFQGDYGSGKTRALLGVGALAHKSFNAGGASTISPIFHILDKYQGTLILDEADYKWSDEKSEIVKILNNGNAKGFPVLRSQLNKQKEYEPRAFNVYGPKVIAMRGSYNDPALESRFLTEEMHKGRKGIHIPSSLPLSFKEEAETLKRKLLQYRLNNLFSFQFEVNSPTKMSDRQRQILTPLLSVSPSIEIQEAILRVGFKSEDSLVLDKTFSLEGDLLRSILLLQEKGEVLSVSMITSTVKLLTKREFDNSLNTRLVGRLLRHSLGLKLYKSAGLPVVVGGQEEILERLKLEYGLV